MPVVGISIQRLNALLGEDVRSDDLASSIARLGCDVEGTMDMVLYACPGCSNLSERMEHEPPPVSCKFCGQSFGRPFPEANRDRMIRLDLLPARPDLMDPGGLVRALKGFLGIETGIPQYMPEDSGIVVNVDASLSDPASYRPFIACAVVRMREIGTHELREIMNLQENLHWAISRDRKLSSIGVYDLDTLRPPITYTSAGPQEVPFCPLGNPETPYTPSMILSEHPKGQAYAHLLSEHRRYPLLLDTEGQVLSMPPIINSEETRVNEKTRNLFIDVTGISQRNVLDALNTLVTSLAELGGTVETVNMRFPDHLEITPDLSPLTIEVDHPAALDWLGIDLDEASFVHILGKMRLHAEQVGPGKFKVSYPAYRMDIRHQVDVFEDLAIGYGYDRFPNTMVRTMTVGQERCEERLSSVARQSMAGLGFTEVMSLMQTTFRNHFERFRLQEAGMHVKILNPKSAEYNIVRFHLMTGLLESLEKNRRASPPVNLFEIGNVILLDPQAETRTREERRLAFAIMGPEAGYAGLRSVLDALFVELGIEGVYEPVTLPYFVEGRAARVVAQGRELARAGEIHPEVLNNFGLSYPVALCEVLLTDVDIAGGFKVSG